jgi:hypothetical protein
MAGCWLTFCAAMAGAALIVKLALRRSLLHAIVGISPIDVLVLAAIIGFFLPEPS